MEDVKQLCKRVIIIDRGHILYDGALSKVIDTYARSKIITAVFSEEPNLIKLGKIGEVKEYDYPKAVINVSRTHAPKLAAKLLQEFPIADVNIEEPPIEAIIREIFTDKKVKS